MRNKSRTFSIYLLKQSFTETNSLKEDHSLGEPVIASNLPQGATLYIMDNSPSPPWWKAFWGVEQDLYQALKGAMVFLPVAGRNFVLTFGHTYHQLKDESYEYDFGLRTTLNALDPDKIKSTDILQPEKAKRERIQSPTASNLTFFDINKDESIIKKLTGLVKAEYKQLFTNITGASNLKISAKISANEILDLCRRIIEIYNKEDFKEAFPDIQNIVPVKDPLLLVQLNGMLVESFNERSVDLVFGVPEIIDHDQSFQVTYSGAGRSDLKFDDIYIDNYREYLHEKEISPISYEQLRNHKINFEDENGNILKSFPVVKSIIFDCEVDSSHYHFCDGEWYRIEKNYLEKLSAYLDPYFIELPILEDCSNRKEEEYNQYISNKNSSNVICLDKKNIATSGNVEPCDLLILENGIAILVHIKISTRSTSLSHLFNQGINSIQLVRIDAGAEGRLISLLPNESFKESIINKKIKIVYGIITKKDKERKSKNLPIFSRISLVRTLKGLQLMAIPVQVVFIKDLVDRKIQIRQTEEE